MKTVTEREKMKRREKIISMAKWTENETRIADQYLLSCERKDYRHSEELACSLSADGIALSDRAKELVADGILRAEFVREYYNESVGF